MSEADTKRIKGVENRPIHTRRAEGGGEEKKDGQEEIRQGRKNKSSLWLADVPLTLILLFPTHSSSSSSLFILPVGLTKQL